MRRNIGRLSAVIALSLVPALVAAACGDDGQPGTNGGNASESSPSTGATSTTAVPKRGGSLVVAQFTNIRGFDPAIASSYATVGGTELTALYDTIVRYNPATGRYEPRLGSMEPNADLTVWTIKLKPGVKFADGTDYNAEAVKFNYERHVLPASRSQIKSLLATYVDSMTVTDPLTVTIKAKKPWAGLPLLFAREAGMIASPTAIQKAGDGFNTNPGLAGAGPFTLTSYKPNEEILMKRNPGYYNGDVYLDELKFILIGSGDPAQTWLALKANTVQLALLRDPAVISEAVAADQPMIAMVSPAGTVAQMNVGNYVCRGGAPTSLCQGKAENEQVNLDVPTADIRVRQAVIAALDPQVVNQRAYGGKLTAPSTELFTQSFKWSPGVAGPKLDVAQARKLVTEVKAGGWDGKIRVLAPKDSVATAWGQAVKAMLEGVGMQVDLDTTKDAAQITTQTQITKDFDIVSTAYGLLDDSDSNFSALSIAMGSAERRFGYGTPDMDAALDMLRTAKSDAEITAAYKRIAELYNRDAIGAVLAELPASHVMASSLRGVERGATQALLLDKAWFDK
jgi:peptide/nickel transport system substrate-binding protein